MSPENHALGAHSRRPKADWEAIERDYRTGVFSDAELADKHGNVVTRQAISKRAKEKGWTKDLSTAVRQATRAKVIAAAVAERVAGQVAEKVAGNVAESRQATENAVLAAAEIASEVILRHQRDVRSMRDLAFDMIGELRLATHSPNDLAELFRQAQEGMDADAAESMQQSVKDMLKLHSRVGSLHKLAETLNKLQPLERKAFALDDEVSDDPSGVRSLSDADRANRLAALLRNAAQRRDDAAGGADGG